MLAHGLQQCEQGNAGTERSEDVYAEGGGAPGR
jgi:hypothetical protein